MAASTHEREIGWKAAPFSLPDTEGRTWDIDGLRGPGGLVIVFICNHCPYVLAVVDRIVAEARALGELGIGFAAICSNDATTHPDDSFERMREFGRRHGFPFPYLHDEDQSVARAYGAACTPDFFGFNADLELQYRGRLDDSGRSPGPAGRRELFEAMRQIAETGRGPAAQAPSIGCSIKWKAA